MTMAERPGSKCELKIWRELSKPNGGREIVSVSNLATAVIDSHYAAVVRQIMDDKNRLESTSLSINSPLILNVFRDVIKSHPTVSADFSEPFDMKSPFHMLYHHWDDLIERKDDTGDDEERMHLGLLIDFMDFEMGQDKRAITQSLQKGQVHYTSLWAIFRPGHTVITYKRSHPWLLQVSKTAYEENKTIGKYFELHCTFTDHDGSDTGSSKEIIRIIQKKCFAAEHPTNVLELPVFPRRFFHDGSEFEQQLAQRGETYLSLRGISTANCNGVAEHLREQPPDFWDPDMDAFPLLWETHAENGRIILDRQTFRKDFYQEPVSPLADISGIDRALCPPFVYGFSVSRQEWCRFFLSTISKIEWSTAAFDSLILPQPQLRLVRALVSSHIFPDGEPNQAQAKGKGLVILLHGPPGSGKTLTAECAAEATKRPLISISAQSLDKWNSVYYFEYELRKLLRLATLWNAVVLFDEADVFLEARSEQASSESSTTRNALVAVFLRHLEYFAGIVFLTTNRIQTFDKAMKSRVHLALEYKAPGSDSRQKIWSQSLRQIPTDFIDLDIDEVSCQLSHAPLNGREISNTVSTARTLARHEMVPLQQAHIDSVLGVWQDFLSALTTMRSLSLSSQPRSKHSMGSFPIRQESILTEEPESI